MNSEDINLDESVPSKLEQEENGLNFQDTSPDIEESETKLNLRINSLSEVYLENKNVLFSIARNLLGCNSDSEDAIQNAFTKLTTKKKLPLENLKRYVYVSVRNSAYDILRKRNRLNESPFDFFDDFLNSDKTTPLSLMKKEEKTKEIKKVINELKPKQREVILMKAYGGLTFEEIADVLNEPLSTVSSRYIRTLEKLKDVIGESL